MIQNTFLLLLLLYCLLSSNFFHRHTFGVFSFSLLLLFHMYILYYNTDASSCVRRVLGTRILCEQYNIDNMTSSLVANFCFNQSSINHHHYFFVNPLFTTVLVCCCWLLLKERRFSSSITIIHPAAQQQQTASILHYGKLHLLLVQSSIHTCRTSIIPMYECTGMVPSSSTFIIAIHKLINAG